MYNTHTSLSLSISLSLYLSISLSLYLSLSLSIYIYVYTYDYIYIYIKRNYMYTHTYHTLIASHMVINYGDTTHFNSNTYGAVVLVVRYHSRRWQKPAHHAVSPHEFKTAHDLTARGSVNHFDHHYQTTIEPSLSSVCLVSLVPFKSSKPEGAGRRSACHAVGSHALKSSRAQSELPKPHRCGSSQAQRGLGESKAPHVWDPFFRVETLKTDRRSEDGRV